MRDIIALAKERADLFEVRSVVIASIDVGAHLVCDVFDTDDYLVIAVGNLPADDEQRSRAEELRAKLETRGAKVLLQEYSLFQALDWGKDVELGGRVHSFVGGHHDGPVSLNEVIDRAAKDPRFDPMRSSTGPSRTCLVTDPGCASR